MYIYCYAFGCWCAWGSIGKSNLFEIVFKFRAIKGRVNGEKNRNTQQLPLLMSYTLLCVCKIFGIYNRMVEHTLDFTRVCFVVIFVWFYVIHTHTHSLSPDRWIYYVLSINLSKSKPFSHFISNWWTITNLFYWHITLMPFRWSENRILIENSDEFVFNTQYVCTHTPKFRQKKTFHDCRITHWHALQHTVCWIALTQALRFHFDE